MSLAARLLPAAVAAILLAAPPKPEAAQPVNLNVIAVDGQGQPVSGLKADDFQVFDNGKPRPVIWVRPIAHTHPPATFIVLDLLNSDFRARGLSANEITHALERLERADNVYLYLLTNAQKIFAVHAVTSRSERPSDEIPWTRRIKPILDDALRQVNSLKTQDERFPPLRIEPTWKAMAGLVSQMAEVPGPKSFLWVTQGVENGYYDYGNQWFRDTSQIRSFTTNLNTLETFAFSVQQRPDDTVPVASEGSRTDTLAEVSALTGGQVLATDRVDDGIQEASAAAKRMNYRLVFETDRLDGKYHKLRVVSTRKDVKIQTADHYYAVPDADAPQRIEAAENAVGNSPVDFDEIGLSATAEPVPDEPRQFRISIRVNAGDLELIHQGGHYKGSMDVDLIGTGSEQAPVVNQSIDLSEDDYAKAMKDGIGVIGVAKVDAAATHVRVVVLDRNSYLAGTATVSLNPK